MDWSSVYDMDEHSLISFPDATSIHCTYFYFLGLMQ